MHSFIPDARRRIPGRSVLTGVLALIALLSLLACGGEKQGNTAYYGYYHAPGWMEGHAGKAVQSLGDCRLCHSLTKLEAGNGIPSCVNSACHHGTEPAWAQAGVHGFRAKLALGPGGGSLQSCQVCHGTEYRGGGSGSACADCHGVAAPHPVKPWRGSGSTHATADPSNAARCAACHFPGSPYNPAGHPAQLPAAGAAPGCFNNTLCHDASTAPHPLGTVWTTPSSSAFHGLQAKKDLANCQSCHGQPGTPSFGGGVAGTACTQCHTTAFAHSDPWHEAPVGSFPGYVPSHRDALNRDTGCTPCHDVTKGRTPPLPAAPSCFSGSFNGAGCHANGPGQPNHAVPFLGTGHTALTQAGFSADCITCHAVSGSSPVASAPACAVCHGLASPLVPATGAGTCLSCHVGDPGLPKGPTGPAFPSISGAHAKHLALGTVLTCGSCHLGSEAGSSVHYAKANARVVPPTGPAPVAIAATFNAKSGAASFAPSTLSCGNTSCHGGQTTPNWVSGTLNSATACSSCHTSGTSQFNSQNQNGGQHPKHANYACTECHAMGGSSTGAANHFRFLNTPALEGPASGTIQFATDVTGSRTYDPSSKGCALSCHNETHTLSNNRW